MSALVGTRWVWAAVWACGVGGCFPPALPREVDGEDEVDTVEVEVDTVEVEVEVDESIEPPTEVIASTERAGDIELTWRAVPGVTAYRILRCVEPCEEGAEPLTEVSATRHVDTTAVAPGVPGAPTLAASVTLFDRVQLSWDAVSAPLSPRYRYRVVALAGGQESEPSEPVVGHRADRPVIGYEVQIDDGGWRSVDGLTWDDVEAMAATLVSGTVEASRGTYAGFVRMSVSGAVATAGAARDYKVRALTDFGPGPASEVASGHRVAGPLSYRWERSLAASDNDYEELAGATAVSHDDTLAPEDGGARYYRVVVSAEGAASVVSDGVPGSRQGPPGVPSGLAATSNIAGFVRLTWQPAEGAHRYHVYRDGVKLTSGGGVTATTYDDALAGGVNAWSAPSALTASQNQTEHIALTWVAAERPLGTLHTYHVTAVNDAAESAASPTAAGRRAAPALVGFEVGATIDGVTTTRDVGLVTSFLDTDAPRAGITGGIVTVSQGEFRAHVALSSSGGVLGPAAMVTYVVRGILNDETRTPSSGASIGRRAVGTLNRVWQRSAGTSQGDWSDFEPTCTEAGCVDAEASELGDKRWYRVELRAAGAEPQVVGALDGWRLAFMSVAAGSTINCAVAVGGRVWCWGADPSTIPFPTESINAAPIPSLYDVVEVAVSHEHACARTAVGSVYCWGANYWGQLGIGSRSDERVTIPVQVASLAGVTSIAAGGGASCASLSSGEARCWGGNGNRELGNNDASGEMQMLPVTVRTNGDSVLTGVVSLARGVTNWHRCVVLNDRTARCWGSNMNGQLGDPDNDGLSARAVVGLGNVSALADGGEHSCALLGDGTVTCWGAGSFGQLGHDDSMSSPTPVMVQGLTNAVEVSAGGWSSCARRLTGSVVCWGDNSEGQLGQDVAFEEQYSNTPVQVVMLTSVSTLSSGTNHHCAIQRGHIYCWGANLRGQLGDGTLTERHVPTPVIFP